MAWFVQTLTRSRLRAHSIMAIGVPVVLPPPLAVVHRNRLLRDCLVSVLSEMQRFRIFPLEPGADFSACLNDGPGLLLIDLNLPGNVAFATIQQVRAQWAQTRIIAVVTADLEERLLEYCDLGIDGFFLEESSIEELKTAIDLVNQGESFCSPRVVRSMFSQMARIVRETNWRSRADTAALTPREQEILDLVAEQLSNKQIAKRLCLSLYTVKNHIHNILEKLQVDTRAAAVSHARQHSGHSSPQRTS